MNSMFLFLWNATAGDKNSSEVKSPKLFKFYPIDLKEELLEELCHTDKLKLSANLLGQVSSLALLHKIYQKDLQDTFPQIYIAVRMFVIRSVSAAAGERSFSKLAIVKNRRRSTLDQDHLLDLITLSSERDLAKKLIYDTTINSFASKTARKVRIIYLET